MVASAKSAEAQLPRPLRVKNKAPAPVQITAEQILREARELRSAEIRAPKCQIADAGELAEHRLRRRAEFEGLLRRGGRGSASAWARYARWEESQGDFPRARSVWERALDAGYRDHALWIKYAEFEMRNRFVNHARNVWDRAVALLPRADQLWYRYVHMEEMLRNVAGARQVFERWMQWQPGAQGWLSYVEFELRYGEADRARAVYERAVDLLSGDEDAEKLFAAAFAEFKERDPPNFRGNIQLRLITRIKRPLRRQIKE